MKLNDIYQALEGTIYVRDSYEDILLPLVTELEDSNEQFLKTVVYLPLVWCGIAHGIALDNLPHHLHCKVAQYHAPKRKH